MRATLQQGYLPNSRARHPPSLTVVDINVVGIDVVRESIADKDIIFADGVDKLGQGLFKGFPLHVGGQHRLDRVAFRGCKRRQVSLLILGLSVCVFGGAGRHSWVFDCESGLKKEVVVGDLVKILSRVFVAFPPLGAMA